QTPRKLHANSTQTPRFVSRIPQRRAVCSRAVDRRYQRVSFISPPKGARPQGMNPMTAKKEVPMNRPYTTTLRAAFLPVFVAPNPGMPAFLLLLTLTGRVHAGVPSSTLPAPAPQSIEQPVGTPSPGTANPHPRRRQYVEDQILVRFKAK